MKLDKQETKEYIALQLPIIKGELQQANNKIGTFITFFGTIASIATAILTFLITKLVDNDLYWIGVSIFGIVSLYSIIKITIYLIKLKPRLKIESGSTVSETSPKDINIYLFTSYTQLSFEEYKQLFTTDKQSINALEQIYKNSILVIERYLVVK